MFSHTVHRAGNEVCVALAGEPEWSDQLRPWDILIGALGGRPATLRVDVGSVDFIDCAAISTLIQARTAAVSSGTGFVVSNPKGTVLRVLHLLDLLSYLAVLPPCGELVLHLRTHRSVPD